MTDNKKDLSKAAFGRDASTYDQSSRYAPLRALYPRIAAEALRLPFSSILDVGCGTGGLLSEIRSRKKTARLYGVDLSDLMIAAAKAKLSSADLRVSDSEDLPFKDGSFDLVTCTFSFHHYPNPKAVLKEMCRVLTPDGRLILADPSIFPPARQVFNLLTRNSKDGAVRYYSERELSELAESAGLKIARWTKLNWHSYLCVARKKA